MRTLVVYPGRFQPFHKGHKSVYDYLANEFGAANVFVSTSNKVAPLTSPFSFQDRERMITKTGIPPSHVINITNPNRAEEYVQYTPDPANTALVIAVSAKDMDPSNPRFRFGKKRDGSDSYMQPYDPSKPMKPMTEHGYVMTLPTVNFKVQGKDANSATEIRKLYIDGNSTDRDNIIHDLYGSVDPELRAMFDERLAPANHVQDVTYGQEIIDAGDTTKKNIMKESKLVKTLDKILVLESQVTQAYTATNEDLAPDYVEEARPKSKQRVDNEKVKMWDKLKSKLMTDDVVKELSNHYRHGDPHGDTIGPWRKITKDPNNYRAPGNGFKTRVSDRLMLQVIYPHNTGDDKYVLINFYGWYKFPGYSQARPIDDSEYVSNMQELEDVMNNMGQFYDVYREDFSLT